MYCENFIIGQSRKVIGNPVLIIIGVNIYSFDSDFL